MSALPPGGQGGAGGQQGNLQILLLLMHLDKQFPGLLQSLIGGGQMPQRPPAQQGGQQQAKPAGTPAAQGFRGASAARSNPNQGGFSLGGGQSEMTAPGLALMAQLFPQLVGAQAIGGIGGLSGGGGLAPGVPRPLA